MLGGKWRAQLLKVCTALRGKKKKKKERERERDKYTETETEGERQLLTITMYFSAGPEFGATMYKKKNKKIIWKKN